MRNLLIECGLKCRTRRPGDTNVRIDGVLATPDGRPGVLEIEFDTAVLDNPRKLLEDVAVLHGRYSIEVSSIDPVSVVKLLPNARSEYYQVISDIEKILGLRLRTVTVGVMLVMLWHFEKLEGFRGDLFYNIAERYRPFTVLTKSRVPINSDSGAISRYISPF